MSRTSTPTSARRRRAPAMPRGIAPMLASAGELPAAPSGWAFEYKWDGVRALAYLDRGAFHLESRNRLDISPRYPELHPLADELRDHRVILDGEVVALDAAGRPSFALLQERMHVKDASAVARLMERIPVFYFIFDLLWRDGRSLMDQPLADRRSGMERLALAGPNWRVSPQYVGQGRQMLLAAEQTGLEGLVAKRSDSLYLPGKRPGTWIKIKIVQRQEFVIGGWTGEKETEHGLGSLIVGYYDAAPAGRGATAKLRYAGRVGTGFDAKTRRNLLARLHPLRRETSPFADPLPKPGRFARPLAGVHFCDPKLVAEIAYRRWPDGGSIQHASFAGLRDDKEPTEVRLETPSA